MKWTYDGGAFEQLFDLGSGEFEQKFSKNSNAWGVAWGGGCLSFNWTGTLWNSFILLLFARDSFLSVSYLYQQINQLTNKCLQFTLVTLTYFIPALTNTFTMWKTCDQTESCCTTNFEFATINLTKSNLRERN